MSAAQFYNSQPQAGGATVGDADRGHFADTLSSYQTPSSQPQQAYGGGYQAPAVPQQGYGGSNYQAPSMPPPPHQQQQQHYPPPAGAPANYHENGHANGHGNGNGDYQGQNYGMKPSQPYAAPSAPPPPSQAQPQAQNFSSANYGNTEQQQQAAYDTAPFSQADEKTGPRFAPRKRINDIIPLVLFIAAIAGFAVLSGIAIKTFVSVNGLGGAVGGGRGRTGTAVTLD